LIPYLTVLENIVLPCRMNAQRRARLTTGLEEAATELCEHLEIAQHLHKNVTNLSVGQQQRVAVARALMGAPEIIIADEPTSALDSDRREAFLQLLFREVERYSATVLFVSHDKSLRSYFDSDI